MTVAKRMKRNLEGDQAENMLYDIDRETTERTGTSIFHILTIASIVGSLVLFLSGRKTWGIFVGLWPPTIQALKSVIDSRY